MLECKTCSKMMKLNYCLMNSIAILIFWCTNFEKLLRFLQNHDFLRILWSSCQICVTSLMSFSQPNDRHTFSNFTNSKITSFWYQFAKEWIQNSSNRSPKHQNEIVTQKFDILFGMYIGDGPTATSMWQFLLGHPLMSGIPRCCYHERLEYFKPLILV